jgi:ribosomal protein S18 acetylase RimI-like enzyme
VRFRACREEDLPALEWMGLHADARDLIEGTFAAQEKGRALMLIAAAGGFPVAQAWIDFAERGAPDCPHLWAVRVFWPLQGAGLGSALMAEAERRAAERGAGQLELGVEPGNDAARRFYRRLGYRPMGMRRPRRPSAKDPEQVILRKELGRPATAQARRTSGPR